MTAPDAELADRDAQRVLAVIAGLAVLAGPRRTRPLAGFLYGVLLSRVHGAGRLRIERTIARLFDERTSATTQIRHLKARVAGLETEVRTGQRSAFGGGIEVVIGQNFAGEDTGGGACS